LLRVSLWKGRARPPGDERGTRHNMERITMSIDEGLA